LKGPPGGLGLAAGTLHAEPIMGMPENLPEDADWPPMRSMPNRSCGMAENLSAMLACYVVDN
jgi:hypothetical protein